MTDFADAGAAIEHLAALEDGGRLPFATYRMGSRGDTIEVAVPRSDERAATDYFTAHPLRRHGGGAFPIEVTVLAGSQWVSEPLHRTGGAPDRGVLDGLVGMGVDEAAARANAAGWVVRAHEREAVLTLEFRPDRVDLKVSEAGTVVAVAVG